MLGDRIIKLIKSNKWEFTFLYLKEVVRLTIQALAGNKSVSDPNLIRVATDSHGLPLIIPHSIRLRLRYHCKIALSSYPVNLVDRRLIKGVLTILSIYRVFPTKPPVNLKTIEDAKSPFALSDLPDAELRNALKELIPDLYLDVKKSYLIGGETAGPNSKKAL